MCSLTAPSNRHNQPRLIFFLTRSRTSNIFLGLRALEFKLLIFFLVTENLEKEIWVLRWIFLPVWVSKVVYRNGKLSGLIAEMDWVF